ncbi:unnamed protein product [Ectocarpus fasciculatus]
MDNGREAGASQSFEPVIAASGRNTWNAPTSNGGRSGSSGSGGSGSSGNSGSGTERGDPQAGSGDVLQQPQQQQQRQQQVRPVDDSKVQHNDQQAKAAIVEHVPGEEKSSENGAGGDDDSSTSKGKGEEKREVGWAPTTTNKFSPMAETAPASFVLGLDASAEAKDSAGKRVSSLTRYSSMPLLSAGPHPSHKRGSSTGASLTSLLEPNEPPQHDQQEQQQRRHQSQQHNMVLMTPRRAGRGTATTTPNSRHRNRKMPSMLGMLQNAQDQAASPVSALSNNSHYLSDGSLVVGAGDEESSAAAATAGNDPAGQKRTSRRMNMVSFGGGGGAPQTTTPAAGNKGGDPPLLTPLSINRTPNFYHEEATPAVGTTRRLRDKSVRFIQRLPGPRLLMQVLEEEIDPKNVRLTTQSEPVILMEVMPAALVVSLLVLTYLVFACGVVLIVRFHLRGTSTLAMGPGAGEGAGELCAWGSSSAATVTTSGGEGDVFIIGADGPDPHSPSAAGCTVFSPGLSELSLDFPLLSSSSSTSSSLTDADPERYGAIFSGQFSGMTDLSGSVSLHVSFADTEVQEALPDPATVDIALEACAAGVTAGVGESSSQADLEWGTCEEGWQPVLFQARTMFCRLLLPCTAENIAARVRSLPDNRGYTLFNFYQNQETIRGQARVRQYRVQVGFVSTTASSSSTGGSSGSTQEPFSLSEARWALEYETGATEEWAKIVLAVVLVCWVPVWLAWCWTVFYKDVEGGFKNALHERKWLAFMGLAVALYLNPIMVVGNFVAPGSASWGLASEMSLSVAVAVFLVVALCIADGVGKDRVGGGAGGSLGFYVPKVVFGVLTLALMLLVDLTSFPTLTGVDRGSLLAVQNWPESQRHAFAGVASARIFMVMLWAVWMLCRIYISGCLLRKLPYVPNRYQQLSYRFFALQAFLLGIVYVTFALWRLIDILNDDLGGNTVAAEFMLFIKTRQDHLGSVSPLCAYALQLLLLFLPSSFKESKLFRDIAVRFVYFEEQVPVAKSKRREVGEAGEVEGNAGSGQTGEEDRIFRGGALNPWDTPKTSLGDVGKEDEEDKPLFCVETAAWLLELAWETYNDPIGFENPNNYHFGVADFARMGFELVRHIHNVEHDTHCFILKDAPRGRLVVAFRGSVGTKHWMDNLRFLQTEFNMDQMMPKGREHEAPEVLGEDIDIRAAEALHGVVAHLASASEEEEEEDDHGFGEHEENVGGTKHAPSPAAAGCTAGAPPSSLPPSSRVAMPHPAENEPSSSCSPDNCGCGELGNGLSMKVSAGARSCANGQNVKRGGGIASGSSMAGVADGDLRAAAVDVELFACGDGDNSATHTITEGCRTSPGDHGGGSTSNHTPTGYPLPLAPPTVPLSTSSTLVPSRASSSATTRPDLTRGDRDSRTCSSASNNGGMNGGKGGGNGGGGGGVGNGGSDAGGENSPLQRTLPISPSGIRAILKGFSVLPWQFREPSRDGNRWTFASGTAGTSSEPSAAGAAGAAATGDHAQTAAVAEERSGGSVRPSGDGADASEGSGVAGAFPPSPVSSTPASRQRSFPRSGLIANVGNLGTPRLVRSNSMTVVSDIEEGKGRWLRRGSSAVTAAAEAGAGRGGGNVNGEGRRWSTPRDIFEGGIEFLGGGSGGWKAPGGRGRTVRARRGRSASFDHAAILEANDVEESARSRHGEERGAWGAPWRMGGIGSGVQFGGGGGWRGVPGGSPSVMEGLGREFVRRKEDLVRGTEAGIDMAREAARRGLEAADNAAHVVGINRIPILRQYLWGQVHTGFWNSYEAVRGEVHACVRKTVVDWLLSQDNPPDIKLYVTGHSMGGALATHCAMDLKLHTIDKIQARLGNFVRVRRTLMQRVMDSLPGRFPQRRGRPQHHQQRRQQRQAHDSSLAGGKAHENGPDGGSRGGLTDRTAPQKDGSRALASPPQPPPSPPSPTLHGIRDPKVAEAASATADAGGGANGHNTLQELASNIGRRFQKIGGAPAEVAGAAARRDSDENRGDDCASAFSVSSGKESCAPDDGGGDDQPAGDTAASASGGFGAVSTGSSPPAVFTPAFAAPGSAVRAHVFFADEVGCREPDGVDATSPEPAGIIAKDAGAVDGGAIAAGTLDGSDSGSVDTNCGAGGDGKDGDVGATGGGGGGLGGGTKVLRRVATHLTTVASSLDPRNLINSPALRRPFWGGEEQGGGEVDRDGSGEAEEVSRGTVELHMFSFGAPRVGNSIYAARYNDVVPHSFRVVVDGDPVPGVPSWWYTHVGTKVLIDGRGRGSLIMDPSFVEKRFFVRSKRYVLSHLTEAYQAGLRGNLLQAVPPKFQASMPAHWPFGIKADSSSDSSSSSSDDDDDNGGTGAKERKEEVADVGEEADMDTDSGEEGAFPSSSISARQDSMAQQAVDALNEADNLNRVQSFRLIARSVSSATLRPAAPALAAGAGAGGGDGGTGGDGGRRAAVTLREGSGGGGSSGLAEGVKRLLRLGGSSEDVATVEQGGVVAAVGSVGSSPAAAGTEGPATTARVEAAPQQAGTEVHSEATSPTE